MRRLRTLIAGALALVALTLAACGGDDPEATTSAPSSEAPGGAAPNDLGQLPPGFVECMADQGFEIESADDIHTAPPQVLQACFGSSH
jgi:hypothetical protein